MKYDKLKAHHSAGFSLIELMLAMLIGLVILSGVMSLYLTTRDTQRSSEDQLALLGDGRFAIETMAFDLRHAGIWGRTNQWRLIACHRDSPSNLPCGDAMPAAVADCAASEYINFMEPLSGSNGTNPFGSTCAMQSYKAATDVLGVRYADSAQIATASLGADVAFIRSNIGGGQVFVGPTLPTPALSLWKWDDDATSSNHLLISRTYYVSTYTNTVGDGLPSLHRVSLTAGPAMEDEVLLPGVEEFQLEFGVDTNCDQQVNTYLNATNVNSATISCQTDATLSNWSNGSIVAVKIWLLMRSRRVDRDNISSAQTFTIASNTPVTYPNDGYRRMLVSSVVKLRNMTSIDLAR